MTVALNRTGARAIVTAARIDGINHADLAMNAAAEAFSIRHVFGFGSNLPEGMTPLDLPPENQSAANRAVVQDGRKAAIISFDVTAEGFRPVPRTHLHLIAGGLALSMESDLAQGSTVMSAIAPTSFAGLAASLMVWLLTGGTLALHHPFDSDVLEQQINEHACNTLIAPAQLALRLCEIDLPSRLPGLRDVVALWRAPEQVTSSAAWTSEQAALTDIYLFGEAGLFGARRGADGAPVPIRPGQQGTPRETQGSSIAGEVFLTPKGTLALRGPMVTAAALRPAAATERLAGGAAAARFRRHRICGADRPVDRGDLHHRAALRHHGGRRLPVPCLGPAGMGETAGTGRVVDGVAGPDQRPPPRRPRPGQWPRPRGAGRTRPQPTDGGSLSRPDQPRLAAPDTGVDAALRPAN